MKRAATYDSGASDSEIVFGSVSSMSGILDVLRPQAARAYFSYVNDKLGGINGRKLKLLIYDDQWDVTRHAALVRQAFEQDKIFAFTAQLAFLTNRGGVPYMASHKVPVIGGEGVDLQAWGVSPFYYPQSELEAVYGGQLGGRLAVEQGCKKIASQTYNVDEGRSYADAFLKGLKAAGGPPSFVYRGENGLTETDFTAYAVQIKQAAADCVTAGMFDTHITRLKQALKQVGHPVKFVLPSTIYSPLVLESGLYDGDVGILPTDIPESAKDNPGMAEFLANVTKYEPSLKGKINGWAIKAWASAQMAVEAVKRADDNLTRANIIKILDSFDNVDLGGTVPPITFGPGPKGGQKCGAVVQVAGGQFKVLKRWYCL
jgi:branched-chain amino acid transport system substrate-binding protein